jgi:hypothetical protein
MKYNDVKRCLLGCPDFAGLDESTVAELFWRGEAQTLEAGSLVYAEDSRLDSTFGLLLSGDLIVEKAGEIIGGIGGQQVFGEMAYFTNRRTRTATIRVGSPEAVVVKFQVTPQEMASDHFASLRKCLARQTWEKFVCTSQSATPADEVLAVTC